MDRARAIAHLESLMTFLAVVQHGRIEAAAAALEVNRTTVTRRVAALETALDGRLLLRGGAGVELTALGERAVAAARQMDDALESLYGTQDRLGLRGVLRVGVPEAFGVHHAAPRLARLQRENPDLRIELRTAAVRTRLPQAELDLEVVVGRPQTSRARARALLVQPYELRLYASPEYLAEHGTPADTDDLVDHPLVYYVDSDLSADSLDLARENLPPMQPSMSSTSPHAHVSACEAGAGIGLLPAYVVAKGARLVPVLPDTVRVPLEYWAVVRNEAWRSAAVRAAVDILRGDSKDADEVT